MLKMIQNVKKLRLYYSECVNAALRTRSAEIRILTPRDTKFRRILVRKNVFLTSVITSLAFGSHCKLTLVRKRFIALVS